MNDLIQKLMTESQLIKQKIQRARRSTDMHQPQETTMINTVSFRVHTLDRKIKSKFSCHQILVQTQSRRYKQ